MRHAERRSGKVLAVSSGGGHWVQLLRVRDAFEGAEVVFVCSDPAHRGDAGDARFFEVADASRENPLLLLRSAWQVLRIVWRERPDVVISTGAAPGLFGIIAGRLLGARTVWLDSIANADTLSLSGQKAGRVAHHWLTQWEHLATKSGPDYEGSVF